jgi:hypothetical protein
MEQDPGFIAAVEEAKQGLSEGSISRCTDMQDSASLLDAHVVTAAQDLSILRDQGSTISTIIAFMNYR